MITSIITPVIDIALQVLGQPVAGAGRIPVTGARMRQNGLPRTELVEAFVTACQAHFAQPTPMYSGLQTDNATVVQVGHAHGKKFTPWLTYNFRDVKGVPKAVQVDILGGTAAVPFLSFIALERTNDVLIHSLKCDDGAGVQFEAQALMRAPDAQKAAEMQKLIDNLPKLSGSALRPIALPGLVVAREALAIAAARS